jgi:hypothetical protein
VDKKTMKQMAKMVDAVQPHCDEKIEAAMTCSHAGSMSSLLLSKFSGGVGVVSRIHDLPNPVFLAVGEKTVYAFKFAPRGFKFKIKKEVARWEKDDLTVTYQHSTGMATFVMTTKEGESSPLEITTAFGGKELANMFLESLGGEETNE